MRIKQLIIKNLLFVVWISFFIFSNQLILNAQQRRPLILNGAMKKSEDFFNRMILEGEILNRGIKRYDFINIEFQLYDKKNEPILKERTYITGSTKIFTDSITIKK